MYLTMKRRIAVVPLLIIALLVGVQGLALANATSTAVVGRADLGPFVSEIRVDSAGGLHFRNFAASGGFSLSGGDIDIDGKLSVLLNGYLDTSLTGPFSGTFTVTTGNEETILWEGTVSGSIVNLIFSGKMSDQGSGQFEGMQLQLDMQEDSATPGNPNPEAFELTGRILDPHGQ